MIEYEVEQRQIRDIMWLEKTKQAFSERADKQQKRKEENKRRNDERKKIQDEKIARQKRWEEEEAQRKIEQAERQKAWEQQQLRKVEVHPYVQDMETCEQLIYYCAKTHRASQNKDEDDVEADPNVDAQKKIQDFLSKGKM